MAFLGENEFAGPINAASPNPIRLDEFIQIIEKHVNEKMLESKQDNDEVRSPYSIESDWFMDCSLLKSLGPEGEEITDWLPRLLA